MSCRQLLYVIRHGERADHAYGHKWRQMHPTARSYDPPLTDEGREQARELGVRLRNEGIAFVISSPFLRCLQTATNVSKAMGLESIGIANGLSEVINDSCSIHEQPIVPSPTIEKEGVASLNDAGIVCPVPNYRESFGEAYRRYENAFVDLSNKHYPSTVALVSHGYAVQTAVRLTLPRSFGNDVDYCAYVVLERPSKDSPWMLKSRFGV